MEILAVLLVGLLIVFFGGSLLGIAAFFRLTDLKSKVEALERRFEKLKPVLGEPVEPAAPASSLKAEPAGISEEMVPVAEDPERENRVAKLVSAGDSGCGDVSTALPVQSEITDKEQKRRSLLENGFAWIQKNWMVWLGGVCVGLAGIFLVRYSIEAGLLGPAQRTTAAVASGIGLHILAEWLNRRASRPHPSIAALAGGASITLYAAMLAALHLYHLLNPGIVFAALSLISVGTMLLALRYGPILATLGILGAYVVPILVSTASDDILGALVYSFIITTAALALMRYVYRPWLWYGTLTGSLGWWLVSLGTDNADGIRGIYLAAVAYAMLVLPQFDWLLQKEEQGTPAVRDKSATFGWRFQPLQIGLTAIVVAYTVSIAVESFSTMALVNWAPLAVILTIAAARRPSISYLPWFSLVLQWGAWFYCGLDLDIVPVQYRGIGVDVQRNFLFFASGMTATYAVLAWLVNRNKGFTHLVSSMVFTAPVLWLALAYLLVTDLSVSWEWAAGSLVVAMSYITVSNVRLLKNPVDRDSLWLVLAGHFAFSLAGAMLFRQASLTLVLATQIVSIVMMSNRYQLVGLRWLLKVVIGLVVVRLSCNPWLLTYPPDIHWSLWSYGGSVFCCAVACWICDPESDVRKWLEGAALHLFVLFVAAETRYWLYGGDIFIAEYGLPEAAFNTIFWSAVGLVYYYRSRTAKLLASYYYILSRILLLMAVVNYGVVLTVLNPLWGDTIVGAKPLWNILIPAYGLPVLIAAFCLRYDDRRFRRFAAMICGFGLFVFITMEIRHLWQGTVSLWELTGDGELYTYSIVWLVLAVITILVAARVGLPLLYKAGMGLLLLVIAKIFLIDMSDLEGLLRVASFMGLGLSLLGLGYLYQKIMQTTAGESIADDDGSG